MEKVNAKMLRRLVGEEDHVLTLFTREGSTEARKSLDAIERLVFKLERSGVEAVTCLATGVAGKEYGLPPAPSGSMLVLFDRGVPLIVAEGDIDAVQALEAVEEIVEKGEIPLVSLEVLEKAILRLDNMVVLFYEQRKKRHEEFVAKMREATVDSLDVVLVKANSWKLASSFGLSYLPAVVYFEDRVPNVYDGQHLDVDDIQHWLHEQRTGGGAVKVTGTMLEEIVRVS